MNTLYFGFAISDNMFSTGVTVRREPLSATDAQIALSCDMRQIVSCVNPSHKATIEALQAKFPDIAVYATIPEKAPLIKMGSGDGLLIMGVRGLPRMEGRHEYTKEEIENSTFTFSLWEVM